jgi:nucleoside-diphosphate-sugar epimerase
MKVLLTGPRGNLGRALQRLGPELQWVPLDRADWPQLALLGGDAEVIVHAASDLFASVTGDPLALIESNLSTTARLLAWLKDHKQKRLVFISSCAVYGRSENTSEDSDPAPLSINGTIKLLNEQMIQKFGLETGLDYQIFRLFNTFGGTDRFSIVSHLQRAVVEKRPFTMLNGGISQRDFMHVDDAAGLVLRFLKSPPEPKVLNLGTGEATKIADIVAEFTRKHPQLEIRAGQRPEAEFSRANVSRLRALVPQYRFRKVLDFIRQEL